MAIANFENQMDQIPVKLCTKIKVLEAINIIRELNKKFLEVEMKKQPLLDEATDCPVLLQVTMKKIPHKRSSKRIKVSLPNSLVTDTTEVCLFMGDLDKNNKKAEIDPDVLHYKELLQKHDIKVVNEVITLRQLRTEYKVYETKRQLMAAYDIFLTDKKIAQCLPKLLGKHFFKKRKFPIQISMESSNVKSQIENALSATVFSVNCRGDNCASEVARLGMGDEEIVENVLAAVNVLANNIPGQEENILGLYLKTQRSPAVPIFISFGNPNEVKLQKHLNHEEIELEELSTLPNAEVKVFRSGTIVVKKTRPSDVSESDSKNKLHHGKRVYAQVVGDEDIEEDNVEVKSEPEFDPEEYLSETKMKKKRKFSVEKESCGDLKKEKSKAAKVILKKFKVEDIKENAEAVCEDVEEDNLKVKSNVESDLENTKEFSPSKTKLKKKHKRSDKKQYQRGEESKGLKASSEIAHVHLTDESEVQDTEENTSGKKTKLRNKHDKTKVENESEKLEPSHGSKLRSRRSKANADEIQMVKESDESKSISKTKLRSKHGKVNVEKVSQGDKQNGKSSEATEIDLKDELKIDDIEDDVSTSKAKLRKKRKSNIENNIEEEAKNTRKRKSAKIIADDFNINTAQSISEKEKTADIEIEEPVLQKSQTKTKNKRNVIGEKRNLRQRT